MSIAARNFNCLLILIGSLFSLSSYGIEQDTHTFREAEIAGPAPERGFYVFQVKDRYGYPHYANIASDRSFDWVRKAGFSLVASRVSLQEFRERPLSLSFLKDLQRGLDAVRSAKVKLILRFNYNNGNEPGPDAKQEIILQHIAQLTPILLKNSDIIFALQAGFIGAWGEWHSSTHGLDTAAAQQQTVNALLKMVPANRYLQIRNPVHKRNLLAAVADSTSGEHVSYRDRIGFHIDCILASQNDFTYPLDKIPFYNTYVEAESNDIPVGGETCRLFPPRTDCDEAQQTLKRQHFTYLNSQYEPTVVEHWRDSGCFENIKAQLGYSIRAVSATFPQSIRRNANLSIKLEIMNSGWASPIHHRPLLVSLVSNSEQTTIQTTGVSASQFSPGLTVHAIEFPVGAQIAPGRYEIYVSAPDSALSLQNAIAYTLPFRNETYDERAGRLLLGSIDVLATP